MSESALFETEADARAFYDRHYGSSTQFIVEELHLTVFVPVTRRGEGLEVVDQALSDAQFDIGIVQDPGFLARQPSDPPTGDSA